MLCKLNIARLNGSNQEMVERNSGGIGGEAQAGGGVGLGIAIYKGDPNLSRSERGSEVDGGGGLADSAFLIGDCDGFWPTEAAGIPELLAAKNLAREIGRVKKKWAGEAQNVSRETIPHFGEK